MRIDPSSAPPVPYMPYSMAYRIGRLAIAIAQEENSDPLWNNPADLTYNFGYPDEGPQNPEGVLKFDTLEHGWLAAYHELWLALSGHSRVYSPSMTLGEMGAKWAGEGQGPVWARNVAKFLGNGVTVDDPISQV